MAKFHGEDRRGEPRKFCAAKSQKKGRRKGKNKKTTSDVKHKQPAGWANAGRGGLKSHQQWNTLARRQYLRGKSLRRYFAHHYSLPADDDDDLRVDWKRGTEKPRTIFTGVENATPVAMERQSYKKSKTEIVVIVHYWRRTNTRTSRENHCRKKYILVLHNDLNTQRHRTPNASEQTPSLENYKHNVSCLMLSY